MKILIIGLGSMGKRRIRNLNALGEYMIAGYDTRADRLKECKDLYNIKIYESFDFALKDFIPDVFIISTPPDTHMHYAFIAFQLEVDCFIEASVVDAPKIKILSELLKESELVIVPSCTMRYFPGPKIVRQLLKKNTIGKVLNINYHVGQNLNDWHPWEEIEEYYVSNPKTSATREIVPFELTWLNEIFGKPQPINCFKAKVSSLSVNYDDIFHINLFYQQGLTLNLTIDVISQPRAVREMRILGERGQIYFNGEKNLVKYILLGMKDWKIINLEPGSFNTASINPEEPYIDELKDFLSALKTRKKETFPNSLNNDFEQLILLEKLELLSLKNDNA
jgi:predicted dehydrogenase